MLVPQQERPLEQSRTKIFSRKLPTEVVFIMATLPTFGRGFRRRQYFPVQDLVILTACVHETAIYGPVEVQHSRTVALEASYSSVRPLPGRPGWLLLGANATVRVVVSARTLCRACCLLRPIFLLFSCFLVLSSRFILFYRAVSNNFALTQWAIGRLRQIYFFLPQLSSIAAGATFPLSFNCHDDQRAVFAADGKVRPRR